MSAWASNHSMGLLRQSDGTGTHYTFIFAVTPAEFRNSGDLEFSVIENGTNKILAEGPIAPIRQPSLKQWISHYQDRITGTSSGLPATQLGLAFIAYRGLAHSDLQEDGFDFLQDDHHFSDYNQMATAFNAALTGAGTNPLTRLGHIYTATRDINQKPLQDPVSLSIKSPKNNVVYTRVEFDTTILDISAIPGGLVPKLSFAPSLCPF